VSLVLKRKKVKMMKEKAEEVDVDLKSNSSKVPEPVQEENPNQGFMYYIVSFSNQIFL
jgi:hypothetical protein